MALTGGRVFEIAPGDLRAYVNENHANVFAPRESALPPGMRWRFAAGAVAAVELDVG